MSRLIAVLLLLVLTHPGALVGQAATPALLVQPGARVRISQPGEDPRIAIVVAYTADSLVVQGAEFENDVALPLTRISRLEVSAGSHRNVVNGMLLGTLIGGTAGFILGVATYEPCTGFCLFTPDSRSTSGAVGAALFGVLGFTVGSLVGLQSHETWQQVPVDRKRVAIGVRQMHGAGIGVSLEF